MEVTIHLRTTKRGFLRRNLNSTLMEKASRSLNHLQHLCFMASACIDDSQPVSILAAAGRDVSRKTIKSEDDKSRLSSAYLVRKFSYKSFASVLRQCERCGISQTPIQSLYANQGKFGFGNGGNRERSDRLQQMKSKFRCSCCGNFCHWKDEPNPDLSLKSGVPSHDKPTADKQSHSQTSRTSISHRKGCQSRCKGRKNPKVALVVTYGLYPSTYVANTQWTQL